MKHGYTLVFMHGFLHYNTLPIMKRHIAKIHKLHYLRVSVGSETKTCRLWLPGERTLHDRNESVHDSTGSGDEHDDDHDLLLPPMTVLRVS